MLCNHQPLDTRRCGRETARVFSITKQATAVNGRLASSLRRRTGTNRRTGLNPHTRRPHPLPLAFAVLLSLVAPSAAKAQDESTLAARLVLKPLYLRGSWGPDKLHFDGNGQPLAAPGTVPFTLAAIIISKIRLRGNHLYIQGKRVGIIFNLDGSITRVALSAKDNVQIEIDAPPDGDFSAALDAVFTGEIGRIPAASEGPWKGYALIHWSFASSVPTGNPAQPDPERDESVQPPRALKTSDPQFSAAARALKHGGNVQIIATVGVDGLPSHIEIFRPAGLGLDEQAVAAVETYRFSPATRNGVPVSVQVHIGVNFQVLSSSASKAHTSP